MTKSKLTTKNICKITTEAFIDKNELGSSDKEKLRNFITALDNDGEISYLNASKILYPESDKKAESNIRAFRKRIQTAAKLASVEYEICVSANRKGGNENRKLWISAGSKLISEAFNTVSYNPHYDPDEYVDNAASDIDEIEANKKKPTVTIFISYSHQDENQRYNLVKDLKDSFGNTPYNITFLEDKNILIGEKWDNKIREMLDECDYGLLLISPHFLESEYIKNVEIPELEKKGLLPIGLSKTDFSKLKKVGIEKFQVFTFGDTNKIFYEQTGEDLRDPFIDKLIKHIINRIKSDIDENNKKDEDIDTTMNNQHIYFLDDKNYSREEYLEIKGKYKDFGYKKLPTKEEVTPLKSRNIILKELENWQSNIKRPPVFALLGD
ncbi:MAG: toll/interleukin-1 receptor domain-containing protein, partial [Arcobacter sp.]|nr:toll/interleukin-1 receptor domain-containing protein [Arcobacter sp.]